MSYVPQSIPFHASPISKPTSKDVILDIKSKATQSADKYYEKNSKGINIPHFQERVENKPSLSPNSPLKTPKTPITYKDGREGRSPEVRSKSGEKTKNEHRSVSTDFKGTNGNHRINICRSQLMSFEKPNESVPFGFVNTSFSKGVQLDDTIHMDKVNPESFNYAQNEGDNSQCYIAVDRSVIGVNNESFNFGAQFDDRTFRGIVQVQGLRRRPNNIREEQKDGIDPLDDGITSLHLDDIIRSPPTQIRDQGITVDQPEGQLTVNSSDLLPRVEVVLFLRRCVGFFVILTVIAIYGLLAISGKVGFQELLITAYIWFTYVCIERIISSRNLTREEWQRKEDLFCAIDYMFVIVAVLFIQFTVTSIAAIVLVNCASFYAIAACYYRYSGVPLQLKKTRTMIRCFYGAQVALIVAKANNVVNIDWRLAFAFLWIYFALCIPYLLAFVLVLILVLIFAIFKQRLYAELSISTQIIGLSWYVVYYGLISSGFLVLVGLGQLTDTSNNDTFVRNAFTIALSITGTLLVYSIILFKPLLVFFRTFNPLINNTARDVKVGENDITLQVEKKQNYFIMRSSTYFQPIKTELFLPGLEKIKEFRKALGNFRFWGNKSDEKTSNEKEQQNSQVDIKTLKEYKEKLDERFSRSALNGGEPKAFKRADRSKMAATFKDLSTQYNKEGAEVDGANHEDDKPNSKHFMSEGNIENMRYNDSIGGTPKSAKDDVCYICCEDKANAILMNCGHGGICYPCATYLIKKKNECMECRGEVATIIKLEADHKVSDIVKGVEVTTIVKARVS